MDDAAAALLPPDDPAGAGDALAGAWVLVVGPDAGTAARLRSQLAAAGASAVELAADVEEAAERAAAARPDAILALPGIGPALRHRLDPLGLHTGPPVVGVDELPPPGEGAVLDRLALQLDRHRLRARAADLESAVASQSVAHRREAEVAELDGLLRLATAAEYRDDNTWEHTQRVAAMAARLGRRLGLPDREVELIRQTAPLHDIGKIAVPDYILLKPDKLTSEEFDVVKTHSAIGGRILAGGDSDLMRTAEEIATRHHERWDGSGYPDGLAGEDIPIAGRLVAVADVFDILVHERPWKQEWSVEEAAAEIRRSSGSHFDPGVVSAFEELGPATWQALAGEI